MINKILVTAMLLTTVVASPALANTSNLGNYNHGPIKINTPLKRIIITGNVDVMLTTNGTSEIFTDGQSGIPEGIKLLYETDGLEIIATNFSSKRHVVKIPAQWLKYVEINGDGQLYSESYISAPDMEIFVNGQCHVNIRSTGKIRIKASPEYELQYKTKRGKVKSSAYFY